MDKYEEALEALYDKCISEQERLAAKESLDLIKREQMRYTTAIDMAPSHVERNKRKYTEELANASSEEEEYNIYLKYKSQVLLESEVKLIKNEILDECFNAFIQAGTGKKRRKEVFRPLLTKLLKTDLRNQEERADDRAWEKIMNNLFDL